MKLKKICMGVGVAFCFSFLVAGLSTLFVYTMDSHTIQNANARQTKDSASSQKENVKDSAALSANASVQAKPDARLVLVNEDHALPQEYRVNLVDAVGMKMEEQVVEPYMQMRDAAQKAGFSIWISSGYRSQNRQEKLFKQAVQENLSQGLSSESAQAKAALSVARPGFSEHSTGLALDFNGVREDFNETPEYEWLMQHAAEYGFVLRYPKEKESITKIRFEPWHFRYVGVEHAKKMQELGFCLEEYVAYLEDKH